MVDLVEGRLPERETASPRRLPAPLESGLIQRDEPLRGGQKDDRVVTAPAVRVLMRERLAMPQPAPRLQGFLDFGVGVEHTHAPEQLDRLEEVAARRDRRVDLQSVAHPGIEVVRTVSGCGVHGPGSGIERHVVAEDARRGARVERVLETDVLELFPLHADERRPERLADGGCDA